MSLPEPIPVTVLTGFLGSGKTTLLGRILRAGAGIRTGVLINEFGQAGLDHRIIAHVADANAVIAGGCLCCGVRPELARGLLDLLRRNLSGEARLDRLVIETSGLSDPAPIVATLQTHPSLTEHFRLAGVVATVDAGAGVAAFDSYGELAKQVAAADLVVLTKTDLASAPAIRDVRERIRAINGFAAIRDAGQPDLDPARLLDEANAADRPRPVPDADAVHGVRSFSISRDEPLDWPAFVVWLSMLLNRHGRETLRFKGLLNVAGEPAPVLVHGVQHIMHPPEHLDGWPDADRRSHLVFIVRDLDPALIRKSLGSFLRYAAPSSSTPMSAVDVTPRGASGGTAGRAASV